MYVYTRDQAANPWGAPPTERAFHATVQSVEPQIGMVRVTVSHRLSQDHYWTGSVLQSNRKARKIPPGTKVLVTLNSTGGIYKIKRKR